MQAIPIMQLRLLTSLAAAVALLFVGCAPQHEDDLEGKTAVTIAIADMTCPNCVGTLRSAFRQLEGYEDDAFDLEAGTATVYGSTDLTTEAVYQAVEQAGYTPAPQP